MVLLVLTFALDPNSRWWYILNKLDHNILEDLKISNTVCCETLFIKITLNVKVCMRIIVDPCYGVPVRSVYTLCACIC